MGILHIPCPHVDACPAQQCLFEAASPLPPPKRVLDGASCLRPLLHDSLYPLLLVQALAG